MDIRHRINFHTSRTYGSSADTAGGCLLIVGLILLGILGFLALVCLGYAITFLLVWAGLAILMTLGYEPLPYTWSSIALVALLITVVRMLLRPIFTRVEAK